MGCRAVVASAMSVYFRSVTYYSKDTTWNLLNLQLMTYDSLSANFLSYSVLTDKSYF